MMFYASFVHIVLAKLGQASAGDIEVKLMMKQAVEWYCLYDVSCIYLR